MAKIDKTFLIHIHNLVLRYCNNNEFKYDESFSYKINILDLKKDNNEYYFKYITKKYDVAIFKIPIQAIDIYKTLEIYHRKIKFKKIINNLSCD